MVSSVSYTVNLILWCAILWTCATVYNPGILPFSTCVSNILIVVRRGIVHIVPPPHLLPISDSKPKKSFIQISTNENEQRDINPYPNPSHANTADNVLVAATPTNSIIGNIPAMAIAIRNERRPLHEGIVSNQSIPCAQAGTHLFAAMLSAERECIISTAYAADGLNTRST
jgi:hypothetical protein